MGSTAFQSAMHFRAIMFLQYFRAHLLPSPRPGRTANTAICIAYHHGVVCRGRRYFFFFYCPLPSDVSLLTRPFRAFSFTTASTLPWKA